ncbi:MAG: hypothetical protein K5657_10185 [Desulfovibrio sp.]|nr:hypothetical protein [Desulfovibrio sp.]
MSQKIVVLLGAISALPAGLDLQRVLILSRMGSEICHLPASAFYGKMHMKWPFSWCKAGIRWFIKCPTFILHSQSEAPFNSPTLPNESNDSILLAFAIEFDQELKGLGK